MTGGQNEGASAGGKTAADEAQGNRRDSGGLLLVEVLSEGPHCIPCEYMIATMDYVREEFTGRIEVEIVVTKKREGAHRFLDLCKSHKRQVPVPSILFDGELVFDKNPGPDELREAIEAAVRAREASL